MSRLDSFICRLEAQRACLNWAIDAIRDLPGPVFELGLGNGRTFDHLRSRFGGSREIFVFDRQLAAHPACIPDRNHFFLGDFRETLPAVVARFAGRIALVHADIGSGDAAATAALARWLGPALQPALCEGAIVLSDQPLDVGRSPLSLPPGVPKHRYFIYGRRRAVRA
ncbi:MAG TPA: class I SAM-dependent methyltransferase [Alphaproteobacteria bacterium]